MTARASTDVPAVGSVLGAADVRATVDAIVAVQRPDGDIPWTPGGHTDPWNLVEAAMALDVGGHHEEARAAYAWLAARQRPDGAWHAYYQDGEVKEATLDTNVTCYLATGAWHHHLATGDTPHLRALWPAVEAAIDYALGHQRETGEIAWRGDDPDDGALLTGSSSVHLSLRCAIAVAEHLGHERPDWELSLASLAIAIAHRPDVFLDKRRWAMDWYYPVLGGVLRGDPARARLAALWPAFVVHRKGVRCVSDRPWVTAAETCELVLALDAVGSHDVALELFGAVQFLRGERGGYWTGANFEGESWDEPGVLYPEEQTTWSSASVVLAADALAGTSPTSGLFRGERLPVGLEPADLLEAGAAVAAERESARCHPARRR